VGSLDGWEKKPDSKVEMFNLVFTPGRGGKFWSRSGESRAGEAHFFSFWR
jgi:hypothetical protein